MLRRHPLILASALALIATAVPASSTVIADHAPDPERLVRGLSGLAPGDTLAWVTHDGEEGRGILLGVADGAIICEDGITLDGSRIEVLWQRRWTRGNSFSRSLVGGLAVGLVAGIAAGNVLADDRGGLQNLGAGLMAAGMFSLGLVGGAVVGVAMPAAPSWNVVYSEQYEPRPPGPGVPTVRLLRGPYAEFGAEVGKAGWGVRDDTSIRGSLGLWLPIEHNLDAGLTVSGGAAPGFDGAAGWAQVGPASVLAELRASYGHHGIRPSFGVGAGYLGELGDVPGWTLCLGLESMRVGRFAYRLEGGTRGSWKRVWGDRAGLAYVALRVDVGLSRQARLSPPRAGVRRPVR